MSYRNGQHGPETGPQSTRRRILALAHARPVEGITTNEVASTLGLGHTGARYILEKLTREGKLMKPGERRPDSKGLRRALIYWSTKWSCDE